MTTADVSLTKIVLLFCATTLLLVPNTNGREQNQVRPIKVLILFSDSVNDIGIDHRIGRQVIKLASQRAKQLNPGLKDIEITFVNDDAKCSSSSKMPAQLAHFFYAKQQVCFRSNDSSSSSASGYEQVCKQLEAADKSHPSTEDFLAHQLDSRSIGVDWKRNRKRNRKQNWNRSRALAQFEPTDKRGHKQRRSFGVPVFEGQVPSVDAIIGPSCEYLVDFVARMAAYWRTPIYSVGSIGSKFSQKHIYPTLTRLSPSINHLCMFMLKTLELFKWRHLAIIIDESEVDNSIVLENLDNQITRTKHLIPVERRKFNFDSFRSDPNPYRNSSGSVCSQKARTILLQARRVARVLLLLLNRNSVVRRLLLCAYELGFNNGEFTFLALNLGLSSSSSSSSPNLLAEPASSSSSSSSSSYNNNGPTQGRPSTSAGDSQGGAERAAGGDKSLGWYQADDEPNNEKARRMFESLMLYSAELPVSSEFEYFVERTLDMAQRDYPNVKFERASVGTMAVALHDSLLLAVEAHVRQSTAAFGPNATIPESTRQQAANQTLDSAQAEWASKPRAIGPNINKFDVTLDEQISETEEALNQLPVPLMWNESFYDGLIANMHINSNGDQELDYVLSDLEPESGFMRPVATYAKDTRHISLLANSYIHWPSRINALTKQLVGADRAPPDEPECGFNEDAEHCIDRLNLYISLSVVMALVLFVALGALFALFKYRQIKYHMQLDDYWWKIDWDDLQFIQTSGPEGSVVSVGQSIMRSLKSQVSGSMVSAAMLQRRRNARTGVPNVVVTESDAGSSAGSTKKAGSLVEPAASVGPAKTLSIIGSQSEFNVSRSMYSSVVRGSSIAIYKDELVIVKLLNTDSVEISRELLVDLKSMRDHLSDNLAKFMGLCIQPGRMSIVYEFCSRGSLQTLLLNDSFAIDWTLKYSIIGDILNGLNYIHTTQLNYHGRFKSTNLVLDSRFTVKITDFGLQTLYAQLKPMEMGNDEEGGQNGDDQNDGDSPNLASQRQMDVLSLSVSQIGYNQNINSKGTSSLGSSKQVAQESSEIKKNRAKFKARSSARYLWTAPEHLRVRDSHSSGSKKGDVYSLAIILVEILTRREPYHFGSNAKPFWAAIRDEKARLEAQTRQSANQNQPETIAPNKRDSTQIMGKLKRLNASAVGPCELAETGSVVSSGPSVDSRTTNRHKTEQTKGGSACSLIASECGEELQSKEATDRVNHIDVEEILDQIRMGIQPEPVRPYLPNFILQKIDPRLVELIRACWNESSSLRPNVNKVRSQLKVITKGLTAKNYLDNLLNRLQEYAADLERMLEEKSADIVEEKQRTELILNKLVPRFVADRLRRNEPIVPQLFEGATIYFSDIVGFEKYAVILTPNDLVQLLNSLYFSFDSVIDSFDVTKIETIIDIFLIASGIKLEPAPDTPKKTTTTSTNQQPPDDDVAKRTDEKSSKKKANLFSSLRSRVQSAEKDADDQVVEDAAAAAALPTSGGYEDSGQYWRSSAEQIARMALSIRAMINSFRFNPTTSSTPPVQLNIRIGIHSGKVCAGIVGVKRPKFCLIGDTVNVASRMHTNSKANKIQISCDTRQLLERTQGFDIQNRGKIEVKGKGLMETFWLEYSC